MELIQTITLTSAQSTIEFTSIPQDATDLRLVFSAREATLDNVAARVLVNGATTNLSQRFLFGTGSSTGSAGDSFFDVYINYNSSTANTFGNGEVYVANYASTTTSKSLSTDAVTENNASSAFMRIGAGLYNSNTAITSLGIQAIGGNLAIGTSASLYKIRRFNTTTQPKATGGAISYDAVNQKWVHVFTASGTFTPTQNLTGVEYLVVAGGGGGGANYGGGGGAGGYRSSVSGESSGGGASAESPLSLTSGVAQTVTVGAGGSGGSTSTNGSDSVFGSITSIGGGRGSGYNGASFYSGNNGGSGGGAYATSLTAGSGTTGQGFAGRNGATDSTSWGSAGGGGGAGSLGFAGTGAPTGGNGGSGVSSSITGTATIRGGGGGGGVGGTTSGPGGTGGSGGGGNGGLSATAGTANTGGGGGGRSNESGNGGNGGSGIVIVRYSA